MFNQQFKNEKNIFGQTQIIDLKIVIFSQDRPYVKIKNRFQKHSSKIVIFSQGRPHAKFKAVKKQQTQCSSSTSKIANLRQDQDHAKFGEI